jgi:hypothetical protein
MTHRWVNGQPLGIVGVLVPCQPAIDSLPDQGCQGVLDVPATPAIFKSVRSHLRQAERLIQHFKSGFIRLPLRLNNGYGPSESDRSDSGNEARGISIPSVTCSLHSKRLISTGTSKINEKSSRNSRSCSHSNRNQSSLPVSPTTKPIERVG